MAESDRKIQAKTPLFKRLMAALTDSQRNIDVATEINDLELQAAALRDALEYYNEWCESLNKLLGRVVQPSAWGKLKSALALDAGQKYYEEMQRLRQDNLDLLAENESLGKTILFLDQTLKELSEEYKADVADAFLAAKHLKESA